MPPSFGPCPNLPFLPPHHGSAALVSLFSIIIPLLPLRPSLSALFRLLLCTPLSLSIRLPLLLFDPPTLPLVFFLSPARLHQSLSCFSLQDQRSTVISLQKLIVREVANEERGLFLITAGIAKPEMMEVLASSKEERNTWMQLIQDAMQSV